MKNERLAGRERTVRAGDLELWAEELGNPGHPAVLLVMGAQAQGVQWRSAVLGCRRTFRFACGARPWCDETGVQEGASDDRTGSGAQG
jgi:hypothetical protein